MLGKDSLNRGAFVLIALAAMVLNSCSNPSGGPEIAGSDTPAIGLSASSLSFGAAQGGANPGSQTVNVTNAGTGSLAGLSASVSYTSGSGWLSATLNSTSAPATLTVGATTGSRAAGTYSATVTISSSSAGVASKTVAVTLTVSSTPTSPAIGLSASSLSFGAAQGGVNPASQTVNVTNAGTGSLAGLSASVSYTSGSGWLSATLNSTSAPATLTVGATTGSRAAGTYSATVTISSTSAGVASKTVAVTFVVSTASYSLTTSVSPAGSGSISLSPNSSSYASGTTVTATASPASGYVFSSWSGASSGSSNPTTVTMTSSKSLVANFAAIPVVSAPSSATWTFTASMSFAWPSIVSTNDRYELEYSHSPTSGYMSLYTGGDGARTNPLTVDISPDASDIGKTTYLRARVRCNGSYSPYSAAVAVSVPYLAGGIYPNYDNAMYYNSSDSSAAATVYSTGDDCAGTSYFYNIAGLGGYIITQSAFRFDSVASYIQGRTIRSATLSLQPSNLPGDFSGSYAVNPLAGNWSGSTLTFNNCPDYYTGYQATNGAPTSSRNTWDFDVTSIVRAWASGTIPNYGLLLRDANISAPGRECYRAFDILSVEDGTYYEPQLILEIY